MAKSPKGPPSVAQGSRQSLPDSTEHSLGVDGAAERILEEATLDPVGASDVRQAALAWGTTWATISIAVGQAVRVLRGLIVPKLLDPATYALWTSLSVLLGYAQYADLGVSEQLGKRLPYELSRHGEAAYKSLATRGIGWSLAAASCIASAVFLWSLAYRGQDQEFYSVALRLVALIVVVQRLRMVGGTLLRTAQSFRHLALGSIIIDALGLVTGVVLLLWLGVIGLAWALLATEATVALYYFAHVRIGRPVLALRKTWSMVREGLLLMMVALLEQMMMSVDQLFLIRFFSREQYGIYALGLFLVTTLLSASGILLTVTQPRVMHAVGRDQHDEAHQIVEGSLTLYLVTLILAIGFAVPVTALMVRFYLPQYAGGLATYALLPALAILRGPVILLRPHYMAINQEGRLIRMQLFGLGVAILANVMVVSMSGDLKGVVIASLLGYGVTSTLMLDGFRTSSTSTGRYGIGIIIFGLIGVAGLHRVFARTSADAPVATFLMHTVLAAAAYLGWVALPVWLGRRWWFPALKFFRSRPNRVAVYVKPDRHHLSWR